MSYGSHDRAERLEAEVSALKACIGVVRGMLALPDENITHEQVERYSREIVGAYQAVSAKLEKLEKFKAYVHMRLDKACVPADPEAEHNAQTGCRIEGRLNWALSIAATDARLKKLLREAADVVEGVRDRCRAAGNAPASVEMFTELFEKLFAASKS